MDGDDEAVSRTESGIDGTVCRESAAPDFEGMGGWGALVGSFGSEGVFTVVLSAAKTDDFVGAELSINSFSGVTIGTWS
jgi:hypothetical protein